MKPSSPSTAVRPSLRQRLFHRYTIAVLVIAIIAAFGYWQWNKAYGKKNPHDMYQVAQVERGDIQDVVTATGTVQPLEFVDVGAQVSGQLKKLHIDVGSVVKEGDLLAEIDPTVFLATVDARRAGLRNQLATMKDRQAQLTLAQLQFQRQKNLMAADATTGEALQTAEATLHSAKAQIDALQAQIEQTQSTLRADEANLNYAKIYAPMSGTVVSLTARQGQTLNANQSAPTILRIADLSTMTVQAQVSEAEVGKLSKGMEVYFTTLGSQGRRWYGALRKVEPTPTVTNNVVLYNALFDVPNKNQALLPSMTTQVFFIAATAKDALLVPTAAVTLARGAGGRKRKDAGEATHDANGKAATASASSSGGTQAMQENKASDKAATEKAGTDRKTATAAHAADKEAAPSDAALAGITKEERRAALANMTQEERAAFHERRKTAREASDKSSGSAEGTKTGAVDGKTDGDMANQTASRPNSGGFTDQTNARLPRGGTVKVIGKDGKVESRKVELGVTNRVQMQVLSGLAEGDEVVVGLKLPPPVARAQNARPPGGMGGGMGGQSGRGR